MKNNFEIEAFFSFRGFAIQERREFTRIVEYF